MHRKRQKQLKAKFRENNPSYGQSHELRGGLYRPKPVWFDSKGRPFYR